MYSILLKLTFIQGLREVVLKEIASYGSLKIVHVGEAEVYLEATDEIADVLTLKSILNVYLVKSDPQINPYYISNHKMVLGELIAVVLKNTEEKFNTYRLSCAGSESPVVKEIENYIENTFKLSFAESADMDIYIGKVGDLWEVGVRVTTRPISLRKYKIGNIKGGMNPTIAFALNTLCDLDKASSYLNIFSGSATLLIEAGLENSSISLIGFDMDKKSNSLAIQNITKAGLIRRIQIKTASIFDEIDLGKFDVIVSDLPFGMQVGKNEDLDALYSKFIEYCEKTLNSDGTLAIYTTEHELMREIIKKSKFKIVNELELKVSTVSGGYIFPKIFVCKFR